MTVADWASKLLKFPFILFVASEINSVLSRLVIEPLPIKVNVLKGYFRVDEDELPMLEEKRQKDYIKSKLTKLKAKKELEELTETRYQLETANRLLNEGAQFVGKTNLSNLIFNRRGQQIKIDRKGNVIWI